ncbi:MAG: NAD-dependent epimerase/dehydratase family protein, partial [bacterium]
MSAGNGEKPASGPVIVTGAAGFIGARLAARLAGAGERVIAVDEAPHFEARPEIASIYQGCAPAKTAGMDDLPALLDE